MLDFILCRWHIYTVVTMPHWTKGTVMLFTDIIAITMVLVIAVGLLIHSALSTARLERENRYLRSRINDMRKQISNMVERPF